jgi:hypothetical protein
MLAIAKERMRKIISKSKFRPEDAEMFNPETGILDESFYSLGASEVDINDDFDFENFITGSVPFSKKDGTRPSIAKSVVKASSIAKDFPDKFSFDIVDSFLKSGFSEKYLNVPTGSTSKKFSDLDNSETVGRAKEGVRLIPEGWRHQRGSWVGDFGPVHTHSILARKKAAELAGLFEFDDRFDRPEPGESERASGGGGGRGASRYSDDDDVSESVGEFSTLDINKEAQRTE